MCSQFIETDNIKLRFICSNLNNNDRINSGKHKTIAATRKQQQQQQQQRRQRHGTVTLQIGRTVHLNRTGLLSQAYKRKL